MQEYTLILASGSPRRRELLERMGLKFTVRPTDVDETLRPGLSAAQQVMDHHVLVGLDAETHYPLGATVHQSLDLLGRQGE